MSAVHELVAAIKQASSDAQAAYATARSDMLLRHNTESEELENRQAAEATAIDAEHTARIAYLGNLAAVPVPPGAEE